MSGFISLFLCQAEDGIRDLVRSRGLGDVYKRQGSLSELVEVGPRYVTEIRERLGYTLDWWSAKGIAVSYTHLTLPTSDLV